jgi:hypothetical protein
MDNHTITSKLEAVRDLDFNMTVLKDTYAKLFDFTHDFAAMGTVGS